MDNLIITAGETYTDIDVLACAVAYKRLLSLQNISSRVILPGPFNKSITSEIASWPLEYEKAPSDLSFASYVIVDISEPDHIAPFVDQKKIIRLFDHHFGFADYWREKYGSKASVEKVGACATLIWEEFERHAVGSHISPLSANLLSTAIVSNTLNFRAAVTSSRDTVAFSQLSRYTTLPENWIERYFQDQESFTLAHPYQAVKEDTILITTRLPYKLVIGQIELWNSEHFFHTHLPEAERAIKSFGRNHWLLTSPSISQGKNYLYAKNPEVKKLISQLLDVTFVDNLAMTDKLILRKEIKRLLSNP